MKKMISVLLVFVLAFTCVIPAFAEDTEHPTIYITGAQTNQLVDANGKQIYPIVDDVEPMDVVKEKLGPCLVELAKGLVTGNYETYAQELYDIIVPIYGTVALDKNGEASDGSRPKNTIYTVNVSKKTSNYGPWDYQFWYDWRISPMAAADELKIYIDMVREATGEKQVNLTGRCYGANVIAAYLVKYEDHAVQYVDDVSYLASSVLGIDLLGAAFSGDILLEADSMNNFLNYFLSTGNLFEDDSVTVFLLTLVELMNQLKLLGVTGSALTAIVDKIKTDVIPPIVRDTFASMPSYWSMVPVEYYEKAVEFVFGDCKEEYAKMIEKTDDFYKNVQLTVEEDMKAFKAQGIDFHIFVKYNFPDYPIYEGSNAQGDGTTSAVRQGFGGDYAPYGEVFSQDYLDSLTDKTYLSPDLKVNGATCLFPENTWFIKNLHHDKFPNVINNFAMDIMNNNVCVSDGVYPAFQEYVDGEFIAIEGTDEDATKEKKNFFQLIIDFFKSFFDLLKKLFNGEIKL